MEVDSDGGGLAPVNRPSSPNLANPIADPDSISLNPTPDVTPETFNFSKEPLGKASTDNVEWNEVKKKSSKIKRLGTQDKEKLKSILKKHKTTNITLAKGFAVEMEHNYASTSSQPSLDNNINKEPVLIPTPIPNPTRTHYADTDCGPFMVYVELVEDNPSAGTTLHPLKFGAFMYKNKLRNILQDGIKKIGRNRLTVGFKSATDANDFINHHIFRNSQYKVYIPSHNITRMGIVKGIPLDWSHEEILDSVKTPPGTGKILRTRRLNRKATNKDGSTWVPTQTVVFTFDGQILPREISCCFTLIPVEQYVYPTIQCFNCCKYGHTRTQCRSKTQCYKCGNSHSAELCLVEESDAQCLFCSGRHFATNKICPEFSRQSNIKHHMASYNKSYQESMSLFPQTKKSYSEIVASKEVQQQLQDQQTASVIRPISKSQQSRTSSVPTEAQSYKKTVILKPTSHPTFSPGYDQKAHNDLVKSFSIPTPTNGCALGNKDTDSSQLEKDNNTSLDLKSVQELLSSLVEVIYRSKLPSNVASHIIHTISVTIFELLKDGSSHPSVEHS